MEPFKKEKCFGLLVQKINFGKHRTVRRCLPTFPALSGATKKSSIYPPPLWLVGQLYGAPYAREVHASSDAAQKSMFSIQPQYNKNYLQFKDRCTI
jgi:hypothetical protein